jgi:hypothetical protein
MKFLQCSTLEGLMVSLVGKIDMVLALLDHAIQKVVGFEGSAKIRSQLIH